MKTQREKLQLLLRCIASGDKIMYANKNEYFHKEYYELFKKNVKVLEK